MDTDQFGFSGEIGRLVNLSEEERERRLQIVHRLQGIWSEDDEAAFRQVREELWSQWQPRRFA